MTNPPVWDGVLRRLGAELPAFSMEAWMRPLVAQCADDTVSIACPSAFHRDRVRERFLAPITRAVTAEWGRAVSISLEVAEPAEAPAALETGLAAQNAPACAPPALHVVPPTASGRTPGVTRQPEQRSLPYRFSTFVVGSCNALAREAAIALAQGRQHGVSPLYLLSPPGMGKTHLARATADEARLQGARHVVYASAESFTSEFLSSLRSQRMSGFKRRYREECDVLVLEDVQQLHGKKSTQLEFFHTLDHLLSVGGRVLLTGDRLPREIADLEPRLASRLASGLVAEIEAPDAQVRRAILREKAAAGGVRLPEPCLDLLVSDVRGSVRDLEGVLIQLVASAALLKRPIDLELTRQALRKVQPVAPAARPLSPEDVIAVVASHFRTTPLVLAARSRRRDIVVPRQLAMYLARRYTTASLQRIGEALGRDHPAVSHALGVVERQILERAPLRYQVEALSARLDEIAGRRDPIAASSSRAT